MFFFFLRFRPCSFLSQYAFGCSLPFSWPMSILTPVEIYFTESIEPHEATILWLGSLRAFTGACVRLKQLACWVKRGPYYCQMGMEGHAGDKDLCGRLGLQATGEGPTWGIPTAHKEVWEWGKLRALTSRSGCAGRGSKELKLPLW